MAYDAVATVILPVCDDIINDIAEPEPSENFPPCV